MAESVEARLTSYLTDAHSIEEQALAQLRTASDIAGTPMLAAVAGAPTRLSARFRGRGRDRVCARARVPG